MSIYCELLWWGLTLQRNAVDQKIDEIRRMIRDDSSIPSVRPGVSVTGATVPIRYQ
jgi:hypothetical protein